MSGGNGNSSAYGAQGVRVSKLAIFSMISGVILPLLLGGLFVTGTSSILDPYLMTILLAGLVLVFGAGIVSAVRITISRGRLAGHAYASLGILIPGVIMCIILFYVCAVASRMGHAYRMACGSNLAGIGKAMLVYANDYNEQLPKAGAARNNWHNSLGGYCDAVNWYAERRHQAYGTDITNSTFGKVTVSSSLYLLVRFAEVSPKTFVCQKETEVSEFMLSDWDVPADLGLDDVWDFGYHASLKKNQTRHMSYAYHHPLADYALTVAHEPDMAVAADRSPWFDRRAEIANTFPEFTPDCEPFNGSAEQARLGNSLAHQREGQNVLFLDSHVSFEKRSYVGVERDNIYTFQVSVNPEHWLKGTIVNPYDSGTPLRTRRDSVLIQEIPMPVQRHRVR